MLQRTSAALAAALLLSLASSVTATPGEPKASERPLGVPKSKAALYTPTDGKFACLDGSKSIPFERVNDDYCDCDDGSDEPGTAACPNGIFHCVNRWHVPANIPSSRVNDGLCDPSCCDGSDEYDGKVQCPNRCKEVSVAARERAKELRRIAAEGARMRQEYAAIGLAAKKNRVHQLSELEREEKELQRKIEELEVAKERIEAAERAQKEDPSAKRIQAYKDRAAAIEYKLEAARIRLTAARNDIATLVDIIKEMKEKHNPNYHDMAVKHAITTFDGFETQRAARYEPDNDSDLDVPAEVDTHAFEYAADTDQWAEPESSFMDHAASMWGSLLETVGLRTTSIDEILRSVNSGTFSDADALRRAHSDALGRKSDIEREIRVIKSKEDLDFGPDYRFGAIDEKCFALESHEYTYTVCMFDSVKQTRKGEYGEIDLGRFRGWDDAATDGESRYMKQRYEDGQYCWNGPNRSTEVLLECGTEEKVLSAEEPEKCVYRLRLTTPAVCPLVTADASDDEQKALADEERDEL
ncbi:glucosidase II beta subunit-like-domain-containing protein [Thamnocephalis sphaerospora]|uniref:Glucosidase 2 subunit beta n=1 Tax=Thamnocephalis sphaerospora TaxID=78915 RepID=A0A4P9XW18_9FUNG|nr:glucosidase II beta subunit-like-domain-containing protein [Thamnocephalis sphaerospora]|eukprot:RKP10505.1 glucosidase II beta subunit-like-domain-containing protein [Thamnocephalis sphaerospora]